MVTVKSKVKPREREHRGKLYTISPAHPTADKLPWLSEHEMSALAADIKRNGQKLAIKALPDGRLLDGRNRELACRIAGVEPGYETVRPSESEVPALVASLNLHRRHLTITERKELAADILRAEPERSNRSVGAAVGIDRATAGRVREQLESGGEIRHLDARRGGDGKTYPTPAVEPKASRPKPRKGRRSARSDTTPAALHRLPPVCRDELIPAHALAVKLAKRLRRVLVGPWGHIAAGVLADAGLEVRIEDRDSSGPGEPDTLKPHKVADAAALDVWANLVEQIGAAVNAGIDHQIGIGHRTGKAVVS